MDNQSPSMLKPTLIGGGAAGVIGGLPLLGILNCACCSLVLGGGFLASFLYSRTCRAKNLPFGAGMGATVGLVAGLFYALATVVVSSLFQLVLNQSFADAIEQAESFGGEIPPEAQPILDFLSSAGPSLLFVMSFFFWVVIAAVFSTLGGLIGGAVFQVEPAPPASPTAESPPPIEPGPGPGAPPSV
jgi:hypothetical protein